MKMRELFSPIPKEIFRKDDMRERVEIILVLFVVAGLGYKFVKGSIKDYLSLDDPDVALAVFVNAAIAAAFLLAYLLMCWVIRLALSFVYENFYQKNNRLPIAEAEKSNDGTPDPESAAVPQLQPSTSEGPAAKDEKEKALCFEDILTDKGREKVPGMVEKFLASHHSGRDLACLYLVLDNNRYLTQVPRHQFYSALVESFGSLVAVKERNFQDFVKKIVDEDYKDMDSVDKVKEDILKLINS